MHSIWEAGEEVRRMHERESVIREKNALSYVAAGYKERQVYAPLASCGMYEGEVFDLIERGEEVGIRLIFVGTQEGFETLPFGLRTRFDNTPIGGEVCSCSMGF